MINYGKILRVPKIKHIVRLLILINAETANFTLSIFSLKPWSSYVFKLESNPVEVLAWSVWGLE